MHFSKLEMKFIGFSFLVSKDKIISGDLLVFKLVHVLVYSSLFR